MTSAHQRLEAARSELGRLYRITERTKAVLDRMEALVAEIAKIQGGHDGPTA